MKTWCEHIKRVDKGHWFFRIRPVGYDAHFDDVTIQDWNRCPICGAVRPSVEVERRCGTCKNSEGAILMCKNCDACHRNWQPRELAPAKPVEMVPLTIPPCDICGKDQTVYGAILFGNPKQFDEMHIEGVWCRKIHVCVECYQRMPCQKPKQEKETP